MKLKELKNSVQIPEGVTVTVEGSTVTAKGQHGEVKRTWNEPTVSIKVEGNSAVVSAKNATKKQKRIISTMASHIENIIDGVKNNNEYKLKICASHFPMQVSTEGNVFVVKNFFGEKIPRKRTVSKDVKINIQGDKIMIAGPDIEKVGETASIIEHMCKVTNRDKRIFQDGIYLVEKNGKEI